MKKIFLLFLMIFLCQNSCFAMHFGTYKSETQYGLIDGFKFNFFNPERKFIEIRSETPEEKQRIEYEKKHPQKELDEGEQFRFMRDGIVPM